MLLSRAIYAAGCGCVILASGTLFRSAGGTCRTAFGQVPLRKARPTDTLFSDLYNLPGIVAVEIMDFIRATARGIFIFTRR